MSISLKTLGEFVVYHNGEALPLPKSKRTRALLAYLALTNRPHRRDRLCELFWDVPDDPRGALRWSLSKIRPLVNDSDLDRLVADRERVTLLIKDIEIDVRVLTQKLQKEDLSAEELEGILKQLEVPLLDGCDLPDQFTYQQWLNSERDEIERVFTTTLFRLAFHPSLSPEQQFRWIKAALLRKPFNTEIADKLLRQLELSGYSDENQSLSLELSEEFERCGISWPPSKNKTQVSNNTEQEELVANREMLVRQKVKFCTTRDGVRIAYASIGKGHSIVKTANWLSHLEYDWNAPIWSPLFRDLAKDHHFVRYDERGNGLSDWEVKDISFKAFVEDLETVISTTKLEKFALLGISQGASVSI
ncbi:MAG: alpha/beta fold hydrolase, partial [Kangiellaceae bacterium]